MEDLLKIIRDEGWRVAVHNDYRQNGQDFTFWLFTKGERALKGEGKTDKEALRLIIEQMDPGSVTPEEVLDVIGNAPNGADVTVKVLTLVLLCREDSLVAPLSQLVASGRIAVLQKPSGSHYFRTSWTLEDTWQIITTAVKHGDPWVSESHIYEYGRSKGLSDVTIRCGVADLLDLCLIVCDARLNGAYYKVV